MDFHMKYIICTKLMTVKWDMQQKHGIPSKSHEEFSKLL